MNFKNHLSLTLLLGLLLKNLPFRVIQFFLKRAMEVMQNKHSNIFDRLSYDDLSFVIDAYDLPFVFYMQPNKNNPTLIAIRRTENIKSSSTIKGSLTDLLRLFEGKLDADAAFFSKEIIIEGSTAASVALRNAIDSQDMNIIEDLAYIFKPFDNTFKKITILSIDLYKKLQNDIDLITETLVLDNTRHINSINYKLDDVNHEIEKIWTSINKIDKKPTRKKSDYSHK